MSRYQMAEWREIFPYDQYEYFVFHIKRSMDDQFMIKIAEMEKLYLEVVKEFGQPKYTTSPFTLCNARGTWFQYGYFSFMFFDAADAVQFKMTYG